MESGEIGSCATLFALGDSHSANLEHNVNFMSRNQKHKPEEYQQFGKFI